MSSSLSSLSSFDKAAYDFYIRTALNASYDVSNSETTLKALSCISERVLAIATIFHTAMFKLSRYQGQDTDILRLQRCLLQYVACKQLAVHELCTNKRFLTVDGVQTEVQDCTPVVSIVRSMYETLLLFHSLFVSPANQEEQNFIITLWKASGIKNRPANCSTFYVSASEAESVISELQSMYQTSPFYAANKDSVNNLVDKKTGVLYFKDCRGSRKLSSYSFTDGWNLLRQDGTCKHEEIENLYRRLCSETHPSYLALMMFDRQNEMYPNVRISSIYLACALLCSVIFDLTKCNPIMEKYHAALDEELQVIFDTFVDVL